MAKYTLSLEVGLFYGIVLLSKGIGGHMEAENKKTAYLIVINTVIGLLLLVVALIF